jgi:hypothetical protein
MESEVTEKIEKLELAKGRVLQKLHDAIELCILRVLGELFVPAEGVETNEAGKAVRLPYVIEWGPMPKGTTSTKKYKLGEGNSPTDWSNPFLAIKHAETPDGIARIYLNEQIAYTVSGKSLETLDEIDRFNFAKAVYSAVMLAWCEIFTTPKPRIKGNLTRTAEYNELAMTLGVINFNVLTPKGEKLIRSIKDKLIFPFKSIDFRKDAKESKDRDTFKLFIGVEPNDRENALMSANLSKSFYESKEGMALQLPKKLEELGLFIWAEKLSVSNASKARKLLMELNKDKDDNLDDLIEELKTTE